MYQIYCPFIAYGAVWEHRSMPELGEVSLCDPVSQESNKCNYNFAFQVSRTSVFLHWLLVSVQNEDKCKLYNDQYLDGTDLYALPIPNRTATGVIIRCVIKANEKNGPVNGSDTEGAPVELHFYNPTNTKRVEVLKLGGPVFPAQ